MPEGDAVLRTARRLDRALTGAVLTRTELRVPRFATVDLAGETVTGTIARGKHLLTRVGTEWTLHTHLKMDGSWVTLRPGQRWPKPAHAARAILESDATQAVGFLLGIVEVIPQSAEATTLGHLGPDLLGDWDEEEAVRRLSTHTDEPIFDALRDQTSLAGIGTMWAAETLFTMGVHPTTRVADVPDLRRMVRVARLKLQQAMDRRGTMAVYARERTTCLRCGAPIRRIEMGAAEGRPRPAYFCPSCQPERS
ncbi:endonuclease-8 [Nocardioides terrae]|uniref:DNA-(apurinic or apyrimidinic site) lyase n=1 Tax=Nocardioides terrae TaxID=574651 RepID=A0A1I1JWR0_9ACTN|nr:DNA-formamidopyrimidine glycosylase family protein [Nocardioides terrae]SFC52815.1 endonuclease-8 [Nocardioides terrae]